VRKEQMTMKQAIRTVLAVGWALPLLAWGVEAGAQQLGGMTIHGFGGWAAGYTDNANNYAAIASEDGRLDNYDFGLNLTAEPKDDLEIHTQLRWQSDIRGQSVELDYVFAQYSFSSRAAVRVGKVKSPLGLYTEILDIGTLRPFYLVPQARYDGIPPSYVGAGAAARVPVGSWELEIDAFVGQQDYEPVYAELPVGVSPETSAPILATVEILARGRDMLGGRANLHTPVSGLMVGLSGTTSRLFTSVAERQFTEVEDKRLVLLAAHVEYARESLTIRSEYYRGSGRSEFDAFYAELGYRIARRFEVAATYDWVDRTSSEALPIKQLTEHSSVGLGLDYWPDRRVAFKLAYYRVSGNALARPLAALEPAMTGTLEDTTNVVIVGTQFSF